MSEPASGPTELAAPSFLRRFLDWLLADRTTGKWVIAQFPNLPLWLFLAGTAAGLILPVTGWGAVVLRLFTVAALLWWSVLELFRGVNPLRRILGGVVTAWAIIGLVRWAVA